jgi:hypothetical protein
MWVATLWPVMVRDKTIPEWLSERRWSWFTADVYGWLTIVLFALLVALVVVVWRFPVERPPLDLTPSAVRMDAKPKPIVASASLVLTA